MKIMQLCIGNERIVYESGENISNVYFGENGSFKINSLNDGNLRVSIIAIRRVI